jgi:hypothetical protein
MPDDNGREPDKSEDDIQCEKLGHRGVPGKESPTKMTPQREKKTPKDVDPGHTAYCDARVRTRGATRGGTIFTDPC